jgi:S1-C subfamily serine protease
MTMLGIEGFDKRAPLSIVPTIAKTRDMGFRVSALAAAALFLLGAPAWADRPQRVSPAEFGRVFRENRQALVQVKGATWKAYATGFVIGAKNEIVFGAAEAPTPVLEVLLVDGTKMAADLLGYDRDLGIGVARARDARLVPLRVSAKPGLARGDWVIAMTHDDRGRAQPFAGTVEGDLTKVSKPKDALVARVDVPGRPGSPVLSTRGELIGVALDPGKRRTRVMAIETVVPFLRMVVLADGRDQ